MTRKSITLSMKPSIVCKARHKARECGETLSQWIEDAIIEKQEKEVLDEIASNMLVGL